MRDGEEVRFVIEIQVHDTDAFVAGVEACVAISREEPGTLVYDWYLDRSTDQARLYEAYTSLEALDAHIAGPVFTEVGPKLLASCTFVRVDAFGDFGDRAGADTFWPTTYWGAPVAALRR